MTGNGDRFVLLNSDDNFLVGETQGGGLEYRLLPGTCYYREGTTFKEGYPMQEWHDESIANRFWSRVTKTPTCWLWQGRLDKGNYGQFSISTKKNYLAHRWAYEELVGSIGFLPNGKPRPLDHLCRVRHCVNPAHLEPVTPKENLLRGESCQAYNAKKTHCVNGHPFDTKNTYIYKSGNSICRGCKTCRKVANDKYFGREA